MYLQALWLASLYDNDSKTLLFWTWHCETRQKGSVQGQYGRGTWDVKGISTERNNARMVVQMTWKKGGSMQ